MLDREQRDHLAALAMQGYIANGVNGPEAVAEAAYKMADAMLAARSGMPPAVSTAWSSERQAVMNALRLAAAYALDDLDKNPNSMAARKLRHRAIDGLLAMGETTTAVGVNHAQNS
jgi:hypothetical protein